MGFRLAGYELSIFVIFFLFVHLAVADPLDDKITAFGIALKNAITERQKSPDPNLAAGGGYRGDSIGLLQQVRSALDQQNEAAAIQQVTAILPYFSEDAVQQTGQALIAELEARRKAREDATLEKGNTLIKNATDAVAKAQKASDLDAILQSLQGARGNNNPYGTSPELQKLDQQIQGTYQFLAQWQEYLSNSEAGRVQDAENNLRNLSNNEYGSSIMPRSKILALIATANPPKVALGAEAKAAAAEAILEGVKSMDDLAPALDKLNQLRQTDPNSVNQSDIQVLTQALQTYNNAKAGLPLSITFTFGYNTESLETSRIQAMTLLYVLPRYLEVTGDNVPHPAEGISDYLMRLAASASDSGNWNLLRKILEVQTILNRGNVSGFQQTASSGVNALLAGLNQDAAGQYLMAVRSYQTALSNPSEFVPPKLIGQRLDAIRKDHPKEYEDAMNLVLNPPMPRYPGMPYGAVPGLPQAGGVYVPNTTIQVSGPTTNTPAATPAPIASPIATPTPASLKTATAP